MSNKTHKVIVVGVMKKNGQVAYAHEEVSKDDFDDFQDKVDGGYIAPIKAEKLAKTAEEIQEEKDVVDKKKAEQKKADDEKKALDAHNSLLENYKKAFSADAPAEATDEAIKKAIKDKKAIVADLL